jgi:hypothetical protein
MRQIFEAKDWSQIIAKRSKPLLATGEAKSSVEIY